MAPIPMDEEGLTIAVFQEPEDAGPEPATTPGLAVGQKLPNGLTVEQILGESRRITVYTTADGQLRWETHDDGEMDPASQKIVARFDTLLSDIRSGVPERYRSQARVRLGKALFAAVNCGNDAVMEEFFAPVALFIRSKALPPAHLQYILGSTAAAAVLVGGSLCFAPTLALSDKPASLFLIGAAGGATGAFISVLQRSTTIDVDYNWEVSYLRVQGVVRIFLGALFGMFALFACEANLVFGFLKDDLSSLIVLASVAGISERFVPEIIKRLEANAASEK